MASGATLTIWSTGPTADRIYECCLLLLAVYVLLARAAPVRWSFALPLAAIGLWGFAQLALDALDYEASVYRYATLDASLHWAALAATAFIAQQLLAAPFWRETFLKTFAWFGFVIAIVSLAAYYTSPGQVLWWIGVRYPDVWGPFLSRNNFAQFLELVFPVALWLAWRQPRNPLYWSMASVLLATGLASASRAGAALLALEALGAFWLWGQARWALKFALALLPLATLAGAGTLLYRLGTAELMDERVPIYQATLALIASRPQGYGLGTYASVYPEFAVFDSGYRVPHAHNDWLEFAAEGGLAFAALFVWLAACAALQAARHAVHNLWSWGVPAVFLHALADFPLARLGIAAWVFILLGLLEGARQPTISQPSIPIEVRRRRTT